MTPKLMLFALKWKVDRKKERDGGRKDGKKKGKRKEVLVCSQVS